MRVVLNHNLVISGALTLLTAPVPTLPVGRLTFNLPSTTFAGVSPMAFTIGVDSAPFAAQVTWVDAHGNAAKVDGPTVWSSSVSTIATVAANTTDSTKATVTLTGTMGDVQIKASADADLGTGTQTIVATGDVTVVAGAAVAGTITFQSPA